MHPNHRVLRPAPSSRRLPLTSSHPRRRHLLLQSHQLLLLLPPSPSPSLDRLRPPSPPSSNLSRLPHGPRASLLSFSLLKIPTLAIPSFPLPLSHRLMMPTWHLLVNPLRGRRILLRLNRRLAFSKRFRALHSLPPLPRPKPKRTLTPSLPPAPRLLNLFTRPPRPRPTLNCLSRTPLPRLLPALSLHLLLLFHWHPRRSRRPRTPSRSRGKPIGFSSPFTRSSSRRFRPLCRRRPKLRERLLKRDLNPSRPCLDSICFLLLLRR